MRSVHRFGDGLGIVDARDAHIHHIHAPGLVGTAHRCQHPALDIGHQLLRAVLESSSLTVRLLTSCWNAVAHHPVELHRPGALVQAHVADVGLTGRRCASAHTSRSPRAASRRSASARCRCFPASAGACRCSDTFWNGGGSLKCNPGSVITLLICAQRVHHAELALIDHERAWNWPAPAATSKAKTAKIQFCS